MSTPSTPAAVTSLPWPAAAPPCWWPARAPRPSAPGHDRGRHGCSGTSRSRRPEKAPRDPAPRLGSGPVRRVGPRGDGLPAGPRLAPPAARWRPRTAQPGPRNGGRAWPASPRFQRETPTAPPRTRAGSPASRTQRSPRHQAAAGSSSSRAATPRPGALHRRTGRTRWPRPLASSRGEHRQPTKQRPLA